MSSQSDALAVARGDVRDGVAVLEHFVQVLASRRVGPRALARSLPELRAGCGPLVGALRALEGALALEFVADPAGLDAIKGLLAYAGERVQAVADALPSAGQLTVDARSRLAMEAVVRPVAFDLGTVVRLIDMVGAEISPGTTTIDFDDALAARRSPHGSAGERVLAVVDVRTSEVRVGDARLMLDLLDFAVTMVVTAGAEWPRIVVDATAEGVPLFTIDALPAQPASLKGVPTGRVFEVVRRGSLPREADVVHAAARRAGLHLAVTADGKRATLAP